ncbi:MAG: SUMF1/EgtB/PvdO family nonheme iron enzyme [Sediminibacterium sp.]|nr:SUMF1/EgtB/PvdO family nonheme iron enzyme [Sediminibacterium sp.]
MQDNFLNLINPNDMVLCQGGTYTMGFNESEAIGRDVDHKNEIPNHIVYLDDFYISKFLVTQELWVKVMKTNPSCFKDKPESPLLPVEQISWRDCQLFISKLNNLTLQFFRLPTEAEWEFAARGGNLSKGYMYAGSNYIDEVCWYDDNSNCCTHPVGLKKPNELDIYDLNGNVWEWCNDWYASYEVEAQNNPKGSYVGSYKILRGAGWQGAKNQCRISTRNYDKPTGKRSNTGFRLVHPKPFVSK